MSFTATVSSPYGTPTGNVQFVIDGANFGAPVTLTAGSATSGSTISLTPGEQVVTAVYGGDTTFTGSTSAFLLQEVSNPLASIVLTPANPTIHVTDTEQFVATGTFLDGSKAILPGGGIWAIGNPMTNAVRAPMAATGDNGLLYFFGGQDSGGAENYVQIYDPATGAWASGSSTGFTKRYQGVAVAPGDGLIYVVGGWGATPTNVVEAYDPVHDTWASKASMSHLSASSIAGAINGKIYVLTGADGNAGFAKEFDVYDPASNTWTSLTSPAHAHNSGAGGVIDGKLYVAGGYDVSNATNIVETYDPQTDTWTTVAAMPASLGELAGGVTDGILYVVGGLDNSNAVQTSVYKFDGTSWATLSASLSQGRRDIGVVALNGLVYAAGGFTTSNSNLLETLDTDDVTWSSDNTAVATIDANTGLATGASAGTANITATSATYKVSGSTLLTVTKKDQTITFGPLPNKTYGDPDFTVSATASSGLTVTFTASGNCTVSGTTVHITGFGSCTVTAHQAGNDTYNAAPDVPQSFNIAKAKLTITAKDESKTYGQTFTPDGTTQFTTSGLLFSDSVTSVTLTSSGYVNTAPVSGSPYDIVPSAAVGSGLSNYTITYVNGKLTVNPAALTITAKDESKTYGQTFTPDGTTQFTTSGLVNSDTVASVTLSSSGYVNTAAVSGSPYDIVPSLAVGTGLGNYTISYVKGKLTVNPAPLTITAKDQTKQYGTTFTFTGHEYTLISGTLYNGDTISSVMLTSTGAAATATVVAPGPTYAILAGPGVTFSVGAAGNYNISFVDGTLTVTQAPLQITANSFSKQYGLSYTFTGHEYTLTSGTQLYNGDTISSVALSSGGAAATATVVAPGPTYTITAGTGVTFSVGATGNYNISFVNGTLTVTKAPLEITANSFGKQYGLAYSFTGHEYTFTSGTTLYNTDAISSVQLSSTGAAATATVVSPGPTYTITAGTGVTFSVGDAGNYNISFKTGTLTVTKAPLKITANSFSKQYGLGYTFTGGEYMITSGILYNGDTISAVALSSAGAAATATVVAPGPFYAIVAGPGVTFSGGSAGNYYISFVNGVLTVTPAPLTITANNVSKTYGVTYVPDTTVPSTDFTVIGTLYNGDMVTSITLMSAGYPMGATVGPPGPTYTITPSAGVFSRGNAGNYMITYNPGTLTVSKAHLTVTANAQSVQYSDPLPTLTWMITGFVNGETDAGLRASNDLSGQPSFTTSGITFYTTTGVSNAPGTYTNAIIPAVGSLKATNYDFPAANFIKGTLTVNQEDARAYYTGSMFLNTSGPTSTTATVTLSATIKDITPVDPTASPPNPDNYPGIITNAKVTFINRDTNTVIASNVPVGLVNAGDSTVGTATYNWIVNITAPSQQFTIGVIVTNYYTDNSSAENTVVTISQPPVAGSITGGGYLVMSNSAGLYPGGVGTKNNFGFNVQNSKNGPKGNINTIIRNNGHTYQIKGNAMTSLTTHPTSSTTGTATFNGKANIQDITNPLAPISIGGNATLQVTMTDNGEPGNNDTISITLFNSSGGVWFTSNWNGTTYVQQTLGGGNLQVR